MLSFLSIIFFVHFGGFFLARISVKYLLILWVKAKNTKKDQKMRNISVGRVLMAAGAVFSALCGLAEEEETPAVTPAATANWAGPEGDVGGVVSADANWNPQGMPTRVMRLTGDSAGKTLVFDAAYVEYGGNEGKLIVGGTDETDAGKFGNKTDGWVPVVLTADDDKHGITFKKLGG